MMGLAFRADAFAACMDGLRDQQERDRQKAWSASNLRLDILYGFVAINRQMGCRLVPETGPAVEKIEAPCLSCGPSPR